MNKQMIFNVLVFIVIALSCGWVGVLIDGCMMSQANGESLGMGVWIAAPLLTVILLRFFAGDGWKDAGLRLNFKKRYKWYIFSLLIFPVVSVFVLSVGKIFGCVDFSHFRADAYLSVFLGMFLGAFVKNFFEESVWRGYLASKLINLKVKDVWLYLVVGGVWGLWHLPYYLVFLPETDISNVLPVSRLNFAMLAIFSMVCWSVLFVELYRVTCSIWPVVVMHTMEDSLINHLVIQGHVTFVSGSDIFISPIVGILTSASYLAVGLYLRRVRMKYRPADIS